MVVVASDGSWPIAVTSIHTGDFSSGAEGFLAPTAVLGRARSDSDSQLTEQLLRLTFAGGADAGLVTINVEYDTSRSELRAACLA
jgi:hypothetical protein